MELKERHKMDHVRDFRPLVYARLGELYSLMGQEEKALRFISEAEELHPLTYDKTKENYIKIADMVEEKNIPLVCVQYPMRSVSILNDILPGRPGVYFVDNEQSFKQAVAQEGYWNYFVDRFAGDFGHMSSKGKQLISENIADVLISSILLSD